MAGKRKKKDENGNLVDKPVHDSYGDEIPIPEQTNEFAPFVGLRKKYGGSYPQYIELQSKINKYLNADRIHTFNGLALFLQCDPEHLKDLEAGKYDHLKTNFKPSELLKQFRFYMENELYTALPLKTDADVIRLTGEPPEQENKGKETVEKVNDYAK